MEKISLHAVMALDKEQPNLQERVHSEEDKREQSLDDNGDKDADTIDKEWQQ